MTEATYHAHTHTHKEFIHIYILHINKNINMYKYITESLSRTAETNIACKPTYLIKNK